MFRRLRNKKSRSEENGATGSPKKDEAIIHLTVPDEVLYSDASNVPEKDMSWLDDLPVVDEPKAKPTPDPDRTPSEPETVAEAVPKRRAAAQPNNPVAEGRPRYPYGWLVVVEGPSTGEWFPLERGTSSIGGGDGKTISLAADDAGGVSLSFDEDLHAFVLEGDAAFRVNGVERSGQIGLRDGDTFSVGRESLRLVALCSQNFHWAKDKSAE